MIYTCIIPCYNSEKTIFEVVKLLKNYFEENKFGELEIILVNDHSKDQTVDVINSIVQSNTNELIWLKIQGSIMHCWRECLKQVEIIL